MDVRQRMEEIRQGPIFAMRDELRSLEHGSTWQERRCLLSDRARIIKLDTAIKAIESEYAGLLRGLS
jgi:hypothetical protein